MANTFQQQVALYPSVGILGARASMNPTATVDAGQFNLTAGLLGVTVGKFAWQSFTALTGLSIVNNYSPTAPAIPDGFVGNEQQALITTWLGISGLVIPTGYPVTLYNRGDFWAKTVYADAAIGQKVFANLYSGDIYPATAGSVGLTATVGSAATFSATSVAGSYTLTLTTNVTAGTLMTGQQISGLGINTQFPVYIDVGGNMAYPCVTGAGTGSTIVLTAPAVSANVGAAYTTIANTGIGGASASSCTANSTATMTVTTLTWGTIAVGQYVSTTANAFIPAGTYVSAAGSLVLPATVASTFPGTITLSTATTGNHATALTLFSPFIETPWYINSAGNVGDLVKIGTRW